MRNLIETLMPGDLEHLVLPIVSIDEYCSKIDDRQCIVIGFYVLDKDPANDLCIFIEKSNIKTLDCEVSPAPTPDGYYVVFVELDRSDTFPKHILEILEQVNNLVNIDQWQFKPHGKEDILELNEDTIKKTVQLDPEKVKVISSKSEKKNDSKKSNDEHEDNGDSIESDQSENKDESALSKLEEFVSGVLTEYIATEDNYLLLQHAGSKTAYPLIGLYNSWPKTISPNAIVNETTQSQHEVLTKMFGPEYAVFILENHIAIQRRFNEKYLILGRASIAI